MRYLNFKRKFSQTDSEVLIDRLFFYPLFGFNSSFWKKNLLFHKLLKGLCRLFFISVLNIYIENAFSPNTCHPKLIFLNPKVFCSYIFQNFWILWSWCFFPDKIKDCIFLALYFKSNITACPVSAAPFETVPNRLTEVFVFTSANGKGLANPHLWKVCASLYITLVMSVLRFEWSFLSLDTFYRCNLEY